MNRIRKIVSTASSLAGRALASMLRVEVVPAHTKVTSRFGRMQRMLEIEPGVVVVLERRLGRKRRGTFAGPTERGVLREFYATGTYRLIAPLFTRAHFVPTTEQTLRWGDA